MAAPVLAGVFHAQYARRKALHFPEHLVNTTRPCAVLLREHVFYLPKQWALQKVRKHPVEVSVRDNNVDQALRALKKKLQREGVFREMKLRRHFEKPSQRRKREKAEAVRRYRKVMRKRMEREGY